MKQRYRIRSWLINVPRSTYSEPEFEGEGVEDCDKQALTHFHCVSALSVNSRHGMDIVRVDVIGGVENTTFLESNDRQEDNDL